MSPSNSEPSPSAAQARPRFFALVCLLLALGTAALYWPITHHPFIQFDDIQYVVDNPHVNTGLSAANFVWAFTTSEQANWHPMTWLTHQLDCTLFGVNPGAHHFVNLLYHVANTLLLFIFLRSATGTLWRSAFVAALFAWHPMHVESVAWAAERKDVLSTFFWLLTLLAYLQYARNVKGSNSGDSPPNAAGGRNATLYFIAALIFCALGLMSKPMVVTLPCALLLLDFWPLNRIAILRYETAKSAASGCQIVSLGRLVLEKIPFFALVVGGSVATYLAQAGGGAVSKIHMDERLLNAALAYTRYVGKLFWPTDLSIVYQHPRHTPIVLASVALILLVIWTIACACAWRKAPYLPVGWFWFLGTLVPTIGLIQVGSQSMADRYTYIPSIGLFIVVAWGATEYFSKRERAKIILPLLGIAILVGCLGATSLQISLWRDSITLFRHAVELDKDNYVAENVLGKAYERAGNDQAALTCYTMSVAAEPRFPQSHFNLAMSLMAFGRNTEALEQLKAAADLDPSDADVQYDLGIYFTQHGSWTNALNCFSNSVSVRPDFAPAQLCLGTAFANLDQPRDAALHFRKALQLNSTLSQAQTNLDKLLTEHPELR